jgi:hypothetical protein
MIKTVETERWQSDNNRQEIHFFVAGEQNTYIIGFNPAIVPAPVIISILHSLGYEVRNEPQGKVVMLEAGFGPGQSGRELPRPITLPIVDPATAIGGTKSK